MAISGSAIYIKALATAHPPPGWISMASFASASQKTTCSTTSATGQFVNLSNLTFMASQTDLLNAAVKQPHTTAGAGAEVRPFRRLRVIESWTTDRLHDVSHFPAGHANGTIAGSKSMPFSTVTPKLTLRGGYRYVWGASRVPTAQLHPAAGPFEDVQLRQQVGLAGLTFRAGQKLTANIDYEAASSTHAYFRTSLYNYHKARIRARYQATGSLSFNAIFSVLNNENPTPGINYEFLNRDNTFSVLWAPRVEGASASPAIIRGPTIRADLSYRVPQDGTTAFDHYRDNAQRPVRWSMFRFRA